MIFHMPACFSRMTLEKMHSKIVINQEVVYAFAQNQNSQEKRCIIKLRFIGKHLYAFAEIQNRQQRLKI